MSSLDHDQSTSSSRPAFGLSQFKLYWWLPFTIVFFWFLFWAKSFCSRLVVLENEKNRIKKEMRVGGERERERQRRSSWINEIYIKNKKRRRGQICKPKMRFLWSFEWGFKDWAIQRESKEKHKGIPFSTRNQDSDFCCMERRAWNSKASLA